MVRCSLIKTDDSFINELIKRLIGCKLQPGKIIDMDKDKCLGCPFLVEKEYPKAIYQKRKGCRKIDIQAVTGRPATYFYCKHNKYKRRIANITFCKVRRFNND